jgi:transcription initiation factor TFIID subunit TAF12
MPSVRGPMPSQNTRVVPEDIPNGQDDDVVARQIREAAMNEPDDALREKLWQEYRDYKKGSGKD